MAARKSSEIVDIKIRMREPLRAKVERAAARRKVSMNSEMNDRLEMSFEKENRTDDLLADTLALSYGRSIAGLLLLAGTVMSWTADQHNHKVGFSATMPDAEMHEFVLQAVIDSGRDFFEWAAAVAEGKDASELRSQGVMGNLANFLTWVERPPKANESSQRTAMHHWLEPLLKKGSVG